jgi:hypothetical protein
MKSTKAMLGFIIATTLTWLFLGFIGYISSDASYKECIGSSPMALLMFIVGWIPGVVVMYDIMEAKEKPTVF